MTIYLVSFLNHHGYMVFLRFWSAIPAIAEMNRLKAGGFKASMQVVNHDRV